jgi:hypothetical protein
VAHGATKETLATEDPRRPVRPHLSRCRDVAGVQGRGRENPTDWRGDKRETSVIRAEPRATHAWDRSRPMLRGAAAHPMPARSLTIRSTQRERRMIRVHPATAADDDMPEDRAITVLA